MYVIRTYGLLTRKTGTRQLMALELFGNLRLMVVAEKKKCSCGLVGIGWNTVMSEVGTWSCWVSDQMAGSRVLGTPAASDVSMRRHWTEEALEEALEEAEEAAP